MIAATSSTRSAAHSVPSSFTRQLAHGAGIFAAVLAASVPLAFVSEGLALGAAVGVGSVFLALTAQRLRIALVLAALMAVLGSFGAAHSIHLARTDGPDPRRLDMLAPSAGIEASALAIVMPAAFVSPVRIDIGATGAHTSFAAPAGWVFPLALLALWAAGFAAFVANRALVRHLWRRFGARA